MNTIHKGILPGLMGLWLMVATAHACELPLDRTRTRELATWKPLIQAYSQRHYGENTWELKPTAIVLHYTAGRGFPQNLVDTSDFAGETPGLAVHYVVDGGKIWEILPPQVRSRGAYGINHRAINIEMVALEEDDLFYNRSQTLETTAKLVYCLQQQFQIPSRKVYGHADVAAMDLASVPEALDLLDNAPYAKIDPGYKNQWYVLMLGLLIPQ